MTKEKVLLTSYTFQIILYGEKMIKFVNSSNRYLQVYLIPKPPKRKYHLIFMIPPDSFKLVDLRDERVDLSRLSFRLQEKEPERYADETME